jgi:hypothetical protein
MDNGMEDVPPIVFVPDDCDTIDQPINVVDNNLNVEDDI